MLREMHRSSMPRSSGPSKGPPTKLLRVLSPLQALRGLRRQRRNVSVRRIDDQPRLISLGEVEDLQPPFVGPADFAVGQSGDRLFRRLLPDSRQFLGREIFEPAAGELFRPLERRRVLVRVGVNALQIRIAPRRARRCVRGCGSYGCSCLCRSRRRYQSARPEPGRCRCSASSRVFIPQAPLDRLRLDYRSSGRLTHGAASNRARRRAACGLQTTRDRESGGTFGTEPV